MTLTQDDPADWLALPADALARVAVVSLEGLVGLLPASIVALAAEAAGAEVTLLLQAQRDGLVDPKRGDWAGSTAQWFEEQSRPVELRDWSGAADALEALEPHRIVAVGGAAALSSEAHLSRLGTLEAIAETRLAIVGLGAEAADGIDPALAEARMLELASHGGLLAAETITRFGTVGRHFVELVEHVHHLAGPTGQCPRADSIRAALFGRHGAVPVNLGTRERTPRLSMSTTTVFWLSPSELS